MVNKKFDVVLLQKQGCDGLTKKDIIRMVDMLDDVEFYPVEFFAHEQECSAMGFITADVADDLDYEYDRLGAFVADILDNAEKETPDSCYTFGDIVIFME